MCDGLRDGKDALRDVRGGDDLAMAKSGGDDALRGGCFGSQASR